MSASDPGLIMLIGAVVVLCAVAASRLTHRVGLPGLLAFLGLGLALGEAGLGVRFDDPNLAQMLGTGALVLILAEGGLTTRWDRVRAATPAALTLATVGVAVSVLVLGAVVHAVTGFGWRIALLLSAILAPTDAAAVFSVLRKLPLPDRLSGVLEAESGFNDPPAVLAVVLLSATGSHGAGLPGPATVAGLVGYELAAGAAIGVLAGLLGRVALPRLVQPSLYPVAVLALIVASYGAASLAGASGFLAVYLSALVLGNASLPRQEATRGFAEGVAWLAQIGLFVMLGLLASPARLPGALLPALVIGVALVLLARPAAVAVSALPWRLPWRWQAFLSWAGLRGAVPIVLATIPMSARVPGAIRVFDIVFIVVVACTLLQAPTLPWAARRLGLDATTELAPRSAEPAGAQRGRARDAG
ncbi:MAG TPA: potassium/proton antiporter [Streptosporangiaceae bacterium]